MDFINSIIIGIIEGVTEFLPVSSTGHLLITEHLLHVQKSEAFNIVIQMGPMVAVCLVYWRDIVKMTALGNPGARDEFIKIITCFLLTGAAGLTIKMLGFSLPEAVYPIAIASVVGGFIVFWAERKVKGKDLCGSVTWTAVFAVAAGQVLAAVFPGTSRSGAAIIAALLVGISRPTAVRFAFLVGIPTMFAAGSFEVKEAIFAGRINELLAPSAIAAFIAAAITAWISVVWLLRYVQKHTFVPFAWYRIALGVIIIVFVITGYLK